MAKRSICVVTGSRAEYGLLYPVMRALQQSPEFDLQVAVTGMHLSPHYGMTINGIREDGFPVDCCVDMLLANDDAQAVTKSLGLGILGFADALHALQPDLLLVLGDRFEILAAVQAAMLARISVAHIAGGDVTEGAFDEAIRHSITKMAHIHFVTNSDAARRVRQLGETPAAIHQVGSPGIDMIRQTPLIDKKLLETELGFEFRQRNLLITFHPATLDETDAASQTRELLGALARTGDDTGLIFTRPNADPGNREIVALIDQFVASHPRSAVYTSLGQARYYSTIHQVDAVIGNSSSGLYEVPSFNKPTVNIGDRQAGRLRATTVIDCPAQVDAIYNAIVQAYAMDCSSAENPYGDGHASERIVAILASMKSYPALLKKRFHDIDCV